MENGARSKPVSANKKQISSVRSRANINKNQPSTSCREGSPQDNVNSTQEERNMFEGEDETQRSKLRSSYLQLIEDTQKRHGELINLNSDLLMQRVTETDNLFKNVTRPREAALDSHLVQLFSELGRQKAQTLDTSIISFEPLEFAKKLVDFMKGNRICNTDNDKAALSNENWIHLGATFFPSFKKSPSFHYMYGCFEPGALRKRKKQKRRILKDKFSETAVVPEQVNVAESRLQLEKTTEQVERKLSILHHVYKRENYPLFYFEYLINPTSFGATVENIFHTSFLIKDEAAVLYQDDDGLPVIEPVLQKKPPDNSATSHLIVSISMDEWNDIIQLFNIQDCVIPLHE